MKQEVFKVQVPLHSSEPNPPVLVYNRSRSIYFTLGMTEQIKQLCGNKYKIYVLGYIDDNDVFQIISKVKEQRW